ncbi:MAG: DUF1775 domain-containing protein [Pseudomonadota bacterium]
MTRITFARYRARLATLGLAAATLALTGTTAFSHATLEVREAAANTTYKAVLRVPHGCDGEATETLTVQVPEGLISVKPMPKPGWTLETETGPYARAYDYHGRTVAEGVREVRWTGGSLADAHYDEFVFRGRLTDFEPGTRLAFPAVQTCATGEVAWTEIAADGQDPHDLERPAPTLTIAQAATDGHTGHAGHAGHGAEAAMPGTAVLGDLVIEGAWTRQTPPRALAGGAYMTIRNTGPGDDVLIGGAVDFAERLEVHEMAVTDGVMTMRRLEDGIPVPAGETVALEPGGLHVMFMNLTETPMAGETVTVTLTFAEAGEVTLDMPVGAIGAPGPHGAGGGHGAGHGDGHGGGNPHAATR